MPIAINRSKRLTNFYWVTWSKTLAMSNQPLAIGIDIGGSGAQGRAGCASDGQILAEASAATADDDARAIVLASYESDDPRTARQADRLGRRVEGIGVGVPGYLDDSRNAMIYGNVRCLEGFNLRDHLAGQFGLPVRLDNDANCDRAGRILLGRRRRLQAAVGRDGRAVGLAWALSSTAS